jgi:hypothetical protein
MELSLDEALKNLEMLRSEKGGLKAQDLTVKGPRRGGYRESQSLVPTRNLKPP